MEDYGTAFAATFILLAGVSIALFVAIVIARKRRARIERLIAGQKIQYRFMANTVRLLSDGKYVQSMVTHDVTEHAEIVPWPGELDGDFMLYAGTTTRLVNIGTAYRIGKFSIPESLMYQASGEAPLAYDCVLELARNYIRNAKASGITFDNFEKKCEEFRGILERLAEQEESDIALQADKAAKQTTQKAADERKRRAKELSGLFDSTANEEQSSS
ncbi:MAG: hypothetical protein LBL84_01840 [Candidatus Nomurabacteria bacterium]|nr:hypothetical protein [Candidatus Nomurabacteria bacterium]